MMNIIDLGCNLRRYRKKAGFTIEQVASRLYVNPSTISTYETGRTSPPISKLVEMCELYNVTPNKMLDYKTEHTQAKELFDFIYDLGLELELSEGFGSTFAMIYDRDGNQLLGDYIEYDEFVSTVKMVRQILDTSGRRIAKNMLMDRLQLLAYEIKPSKWL